MSEQRAPQQRRKGTSKLIGRPLDDNGSIELAAASLPESQPSPEEPPVESMSANDLIDWIAYHANKQDRDWEYLRKELLRRVSQPSPSGDAQRLVGNLLDMWDQMANDTQDLIRETETGFYNAVEAFRAALQESPSE